MQIVPITYRAACEFVKRHHRHHKPPQGHKFSIGLNVNGELVGVAICGRPVARKLDNGFTMEVTRCCTDGTKNACSKLYSACWRVAKNMGYRELITYVLETETGTSLKASGWVCIGKAGGGNWNVTTRPREDSSHQQMKIKFSIAVQLNSIKMNKEKQNGESKARRASKALLDLKLKEIEVFFSENKAVLNIWIRLQEEYREANSQEITIMLNEGAELLANKKRKDKLF